MYYDDTTDLEKAINYTTVLR